MELLYTTHRKINASSFNFADNQQNLEYFCSVSTCNVIAFATTNELTESPGNAWGFHIYVADLNTPWFPYKVMSNKYPISVLEWDVLGRFLLIGDRNGNIQIFVQKDNLLSEWKPIYNIVFPGEHIIRALFFHNGRKINIQGDKKDQYLYLDKFQKSKFAASVRQFGGVPVDGCLIISSTGMLGAFIIPTESYANVQKIQDVIKLEPVTESLGLTRNFYTTADVSYGNNGQFLVVVANGDNKSTSSNMIQCYRVNVKKVADNLEIISNSLPSFFISEGLGKDLKDLKISSLKWVYSEDADSLVVASNHAGGSFIEQWELTEESTPIHKLFQTNKNEMFKTIVWNSKAQYRNNTKVVKVCTTKFNYTNSTHIFLAMNDNSIHCLNRDSLKRLTCANIISFRDPNDHSSKQLRLGVKVGAIGLSCMSHLFTAIDTSGQLYVYKCNFMCQDQLGTPALIVQTVNLLEYCLITGFDCLDVLLTLKTQILDNILERLTENFNRQPSSVQQYYYVNFLTMKISLYRLSMSGQQKAHDLSNLLMLHSILIAFKSLLRPSDLTSHDKGPAENLAMVLSESLPDVDKVLLNLEAKDFTVEPSTLQSLQQLIQWVADLALNILAKLPESRTFMVSNKSAGYDISKDIVALNSIRELLVMIRIWGLLNPQCLPAFSRSADNSDILLTLFRLLTKLALNPNEPDELLLDDCCSLPSLVLIPQLQFVASRTMIASPLLVHMTLPLYCDYNTEYELLKFCPEVPVVEGGLSNDNVIDSVRYLQLGKRPPLLRRCTRCGSCSSVISVAKTAAMKAWEQRWVNKCRCNGFWRLETTI